MLMHGHNVHATTKTPSFGTRPNVPSAAPSSNSIIMQYNYMFNRRENV
jgi:hypothetical protein